jgi:hypothetical protein
MVKDASIEAVSDKVAESLPLGVPVSPKLPSSAPLKVSDPVRVPEMLGASVAVLTSAAEVPVSTDVSCPVGVSAASNTATEVAVSVPEEVSPTPARAIAGAGASDASKVSAGGSTTTPIAEVPSAPEIASEPCMRKGSTASLPEPVSPPLRVTDTEAVSVTVADSLAFFVTWSSREPLSVAAPESLLDAVTDKVTVPSAAVPVSPAV